MPRRRHFVLASSALAAAGFVLPARADDEKEIDYLFDRAARVASGMVSAGVVRA